MDLVEPPPAKTQAVRKEPSLAATGSNWLVHSAELHGEESQVANPRCLYLVQCFTTYTCVIADMYADRIPDMVDIIRASQQFPSGKLSAQVLYDKKYCRQAAANWSNLSGVYIPGSLLGGHAAGGRSP